MRKINLKVELDKIRQRDDYARDKQKNDKVAYARHEECKMFTNLVKKKQNKNLYKKLKYKKLELEKEQ